MPFDAATSAEISPDVAAIRALLRAGRLVGLVIYRGPSAIDGQPIAVIASCFTGSRNAKNGNMVQTFIIRSDVHPVEALRTGADVSICGDCPHRPALLASTGAARCYVEVGKSVAAVYGALVRGSYLDVTGYSPAEISAIFAGYSVRIGTYGDPGAAPSIWPAVVARARMWTGYSHQWRAAPELAALVMASVESEAEACEAHAAGFRSFRVAPPVGWSKMSGEGLCPASEEAGHATSCGDCGLCSGADGKGRASIMIPDHSPAGRAAKARAAAAA